MGDWLRRRRSVERPLSPATRTVRLTCVLAFHLGSWGFFLRMWGSAFFFAIVCGLFGEGFELLRLRGSGIVLPGFDLRATLFVSYATLGLFSYGIAGLVTGEARKQLAAAVFAAFIFVPWANFEYLPAAGSWRSVLGSAAVAGVVAALGWQAARIPRTAAALVLAVAIGANIAPSVGSSPGSNTSNDASGRPNLVVFLIDTLRADHLGVYGYDRPTSPNIDRVAAQAVVFDRAVAQASWTKPSVASLFTGRFVHNHGVISSHDALGPDLPTLASLLDQAGYRTAAFSGNPWITPEFRFSRGFDDFESGRAIGPQLTNLYRTIRRGERLLKKLGVGVSVANFVFRWSGRSNTGNAERDDALADSVIDWLAAVDESEPFFLYVHLIGPHDPYDPPEAFAKAFARSTTAAPRLPPARVQTVFERAEAMDDEARLRLVDQYDAAIAHSDSLVGRILDRLAARQLDDETIVIITADHGEEFYEHGNWRHGNQLYDEVVRVPLIVRLPGEAAGRRRADPAMVIDILPTSLGLLGLDGAVLEGVQLDGRALFPAPPVDAPPTLSEHFWHQGGTYTSRAIGRGGLKLHISRLEDGAQERQELYDLRSDPGERRNVLTTGGPGDEPSAELDALRGLLANLAREGPATSGAAVKGFDAATEDRLRALGYLGGD